MEILILSSVTLVNEGLAALVASDSSFYNISQVDDFGVADRAIQAGKCDLAVVYVTKDEVFEERVKSFFLNNRRVPIILVNEQNIRWPFSLGDNITNCTVNTNANSLLKIVRKIYKTVRCSSGPYWPTPSVNAERANPEPAPVEHRAKTFTARQWDVLQHIYKGKSNKEIANELGLAEGTVKIHCMTIFRKLKVSNRTQAAIAAKALFESDSNHYTTQFVQGWN